MPYICIYIYAYIDPPKPPQLIGSPMAVPGFRGLPDPGPPPLSGSSRPAKVDPRLRIRPAPRHARAHGNVPLSYAHFWMSVEETVQQNVQHVWDGDMHENHGATRGVGLNFQLQPGVAIPRAALKPSFSCALAPPLPRPCAVPRPGRSSEYGPRARSWSC